MTEDELYRQNIEKLMLAGSSELISNNLPQHAAALLACFFRNATSEVKIFCNTLRNEVYDTQEVLSSMLACVRRGIPIQVLVRLEPKEDSKFRSCFIEATKSQSAKYSLTTNAAEKSQLVKELGDNFSVMDARAYRWETDCSNVHAVACMNAPSLAITLGKTFDRLYASTLHAPQLA